MLRLHEFILSAALLASGPAIAVECSAQSPAHTVALVELYTSEGCSSCPPADRWLSGLRDAGFGPNQVVPLALHVDYWNYLGWPDPFSQALFSARQRETARLNGLRTIYTPQVTLQGKDFRGWNGNRFADAVQAINGQPARADLRLRAIASQDAVSLSLKGSVRDPRDPSSTQVYLALVESQLNTPVPAGENAGRTLRHDHVARVWLGPFRVTDKGGIDLTRNVPLGQGWNRSRLGAVAFVQDGRSGEILQAVAVAACAG
jgi:hypothetical protein